MIKTVLDIPKYTGGTSALQNMADYLEDDLGGELATALGYVVRTDLTAIAPTYATYSVVVFLAKTALSTPEFCIYSSNSSSNTYTTINIAPCILDGSTWKPAGAIETGGSNTVPERNVYKTKMNVASYDPVFVVYDFEDGRYFVCYYTSQTGTNIRGGFLVWPIKVNGTTVQSKFISLALGFATSYLDELNAPSYGTDLHAVAMITASTYDGSTAGLCNASEEYLIAPTRYSISTTVSAENLAWFSNKQNALEGTYVMINNRTYVIMWRCDTQTGDTSRRAWLVSPVD